jgi:hypothetical protein
MRAEYPKLVILSSVRRWALGYNFGVIFRMWSLRHKSFLVHGNFSDAELLLHGVTPVCVRTRSRLLNCDLQTPDTLPYHALVAEVTFGRGSIVCDGVAFPNPSRT